MVDEQPNILLLMSDQHNSRYLSHRETDVPVRTPTLDDLAENGVTLDRAYCPVPICTPSRLSILTGREARNAGAWENSSLLKPELPTLPETLSEAGYATCLQGKMHLGGDRQFAGFDHRGYGDLTGQTGHQADPPTAGLEGGWERASRITDAGVTGIPESMMQEHNAAWETVSFLREHRHRSHSEPWFACVSFSRPHWPRTAPRRFIDRHPSDDLPPLRTGPTAADEHPHVEKLRTVHIPDGIDESAQKNARAAYASCVDYLDEIIGDLLGTLERDGFLENTIVIYVSDHGELAGEHGLWEKQTWHEDSIRVPWIIQLPSHRAGECSPGRLQTPVSLIDLFPTVCGLSGVPTPNSVDGVDLSGSIRRTAEPSREPVFVDYLASYSADEGYVYRAIIDGRHKYVHYQDAPDRLFDLEADPLEEHDQIGKEEYGSVETSLRTLAEDTLDFEEAAVERAADREHREDHKLGIPSGTGNAYYLPDGRLVDADTPLYQPHILAEDPDVVFDDHP
ncbi:sulfatase [Haloferax sp. ATB1]|uniref:sulfatase family protein n=1 Tax=Haloferax sp. ATB1 TaxID=1508454 RepID=UPI0009E45082|nr:sulfatase-like hydrolase/transferase [Haloferax sp. ATB1]